MLVSNSLCLVKVDQKVCPHAKITFEYFSLICSLLSVSGGCRMDFGSNLQFATIVPSSCVQCMQIAVSRQNSA